VSVSSLVTVQLMLSNAFQPIQYLGSIYSCITNAFVDMASLSQIFKENSNITDKLNAIDLNDIKI